MNNLSLMDLIREKSEADVRWLESHLLREYQSPRKDSELHRWLFEADGHNTSDQPPGIVVKNALQKFLTERKPPEVLAEELQALRLPEAMSPHAR